MQASFAADRRSSPLALWMPFGTRLSQPTDVALEAFIAQLTASCPGLYSRQALRKRCRDVVVQALGAFGLGVVLRGYSTMEGDAMASWSTILTVIAVVRLVTALQLWRTLRATVRLRHDRRSPATADPTANRGTLPSDGSN